MTHDEINKAIAAACGYEADYYNDLNAMHEAEKITFKNNALLWHRYASFLDRDYCNQPYTIGSTAWQRAEAFLKTLNLWKQ